MKHLTEEDNWEEGWWWDCKKSKHKTEIWGSNYHSKCNPARKIKPSTERQIKTSKYSAPAQSEKSTRQTPWDSLQVTPLPCCLWSKMICHFLQRRSQPAGPFYLLHPTKCGILHWQICCEARAQVKLRIADGKPAAAEAKMPVQG